MNKRCSNPSCRKVFSTLYHGDTCPHCGKVYPCLRGYYSKKAYYIELDGKRVDLDVQKVKEIFELVDAGRKLRAMKALWEVRIGGRCLTLRVLKHTIDALCARKPVPVVWKTRPDGQMAATAYARWERP